MNEILWNHLASRVDSRDIDKAKDASGICGFMSNCRHCVELNYSDIKICCMSAACEHKLLSDEDAKIEYLKKQLSRLDNICKECTSQNNCSECKIGKEIATIKAQIEELGGATSDDTVKKAWDKTLRYIRTGRE